MTERMNSKTVIFTRPFLLKGIDRILPAGEYRVVTEEQLIENLSFPVYRRVSTVIFVPAETASSVEMVTIDPRDLEAALVRDVATPAAPTEAAPLQPEITRKTDSYPGDQKFA